MARILIIGRAPQAPALAEAVLGLGHAVRIVDGPDRRLRAAGASADRQRERGRSAIERVAGDPLRLGTLRGALAQVTIACWLFGTDCAGAEEAAALHGQRLASFIPQLVDAGGRGLLYERAGAQLPGSLRAAGERIVRELCLRNELALSMIDAEPDAPGRWLERASAAIAQLLEH
jgi:hypothetical protein